jgi:hypothetical protein
VTSLHSGYGSASKPNRHSLANAFGVAQFAEIDADLNKQGSIQADLSAITRKKQLRQEAQPRRQPEN